jgi:2-keto-4-pentenoate hydratase/2-oxohepta-3-ene-1,7-dioic acid hydratase in catechol pathway
MYLARARVNEAGEPATRIVASSDPRSGHWIDVRRHYQRDLERSGATPSKAADLARVVVSGSLTHALASGDLFLDIAESAARSERGDAEMDRPEFDCPVDPPVYRDFMVFEDHFSFGAKWRGEPVPEVLYQQPVSYIGGIAGFRGPGEEIAWPAYSNCIDFELEIGIVIKRGGRNLLPEEARSSILGLTILNDFSARDIQAAEMTAGLGPSKGKHFASAAGPWIATLDELPDGGLEARASIDGETLVTADTGEMIWSIEEIVAWASANENLIAGSLLGTGTVNGGSGLEQQRFLNFGETIELWVDNLGTLANTITEPEPSWQPRPRQGVSCERP